jgi:amidophosphoribosyltransferase
MAGAKAEKLNAVRQPVGCIFLLNPSPTFSLSESHRPKHECGVFAVYGHKDAALLNYYGLFALQHRGQESAGIASSNGDGETFHLHKGMGLVSQVFAQENLESLEGNRAIGHVRYSTTGSSTLLNSQPLVVDTARGQIAVAHNGNLVNAASLRAELEMRGSIFQTTVDSEIILHLLAQPDDTMGGPIGSFRKLAGAFSVVVMGEKEIIGVRDPSGLRPLSLGKLDDGWVLSSETCAFDLIGATFIRDIKPGEVVVINDQGIRSEFPLPKAERPFVSLSTSISRARTAACAA